MKFKFYPFSLIGLYGIIFLFTTCKKEINKTKISSSGIKYFTCGLNDKVKKVEKTADGGFIYCGSTLKNGSTSDAFLLKIDVGGNQQWYRTFGGKRDDWFNHVIQTSDGGFIAVGLSNSFGQGTIDSTFRRMDYVVKLNSNGDEQWSKSYSQSNPFDIELNNVLESSDHFFYATGGIYGDAFTGFNTMLLKFDGNGKLFFDKQYTSFSSYPPKLIKDTWQETGLTLSENKNGSILIGGVMNPSSNYVQNDNYNTFLISANSSGALNFYYPYYDYIRGYNYYRNSNYKYSTVKILVIQDGYMIGTYFELPNSTVVFQLIKTDFNGNIIWEKKYPGLGNMIMADIQLLNDDEIIMTGASTQNSMSFAFPELFENLKSTLIKLDKNGNIIWSSFIGSNENAVVAQCLQSSDEGGWVIAGHTCLSESGFDKLFWLKLDKNGKLIPEK